MKYLISIVITLTIWCTSLSAQTNEEKGLEIIEKHCLRQWFYRQHRRGTDGFKR